MSDTNPIAVDLTDGVGALNSGSSSTASVLLSVNRSASGNGTITSANFYQDVDGNGTYQLVASTNPTVTVGPNTTGQASASLAAPTGADYQVVAAWLPNLFSWEQGELGEVIVRNLDASTWSASGGYALRSGDSVNRWGLSPLALTASIAPMQYSPDGSSDPFQFYDPSTIPMTTDPFIFNVTAPPVTTLVYPTPYSSTTPATPASLPFSLAMTHSGNPLTGQAMTTNVVVTRFPDDEPFTDGAWASPQIEECAGRVPLIVGGYPDGTYKPDTGVTRDQMAVFIQRALALPLGTYQSHFPDVPSTYWAALQILALYNAGLVGGYSDSTYGPGLPVDRARDGRLRRPRDDRQQERARRTADRDLHGRSDELFGPITKSSTVRATASSMAIRPPPIRRAPRWIAARWPCSSIGPSSSRTRASSCSPGRPSPRRIRETGGRACGWASTDSASASAPGYAYVSFDAARMGTTLAYGGLWNVTFELRSASAPSTPATGAYTYTYSEASTSLAAQIGLAAIDRQSLSHPLVACYRPASRRAATCWW